jgi:acetyl esterase
VTIAPEIRSLIDWAEAINKSTGAQPLPELRETLRQALDDELRRRGVTTEQVRAVRDLIVPVHGGEIRVRLFTPMGPEPHPALVHFHGGGFVFGTIDSLVNDAKCADICRHADCAVVTVEYRLAPEHPFPTAPEDCYAALLWVAEHSPELGIDATRLAVGGESAGGNLAAVVALMARDRDGPRLSLQVLEVPVTDLGDGADSYPSVGSFGDGYGLDRVDMDSFGEAYLADSGDGSNPYASPLLAPDLAGVAPAHVLTAEYDMLHSGEAYARRLDVADVETTLHPALGLTHGAPVLWQEWGPARDWIDEVVRALTRALHAPKIGTPETRVVPGAGQAL